MSINYQVAKQNEICEKHDALNTMPGSQGVIGVSNNIHDDAAGPINGLRHPVTNTTTGWYIWRGDYSEDDNFFQATHLEHLAEDCPEIVPYLALPPGWRFLIDPGNNYEDVWYDEALLEV